MHDPTRDPTATAAAHDAALAEALERELLAVRRLRVEVELVQPGLLLERLEGWHSGAAEHYAERVREVRLGLAGALHLLAATESAVADAVESARVRGAWE